jgi:hypothetical protein
LPPEAFNHVTHQIIWDKVKGTESPHKAVYAAMRAEPDFVAEARARLKESLTGECLSAGPAQAMVDEATVLRWQTYQKAKEFPAWSNHMTAALGEKSKPLFRGVFDWIREFKPSSNPNRTGIIESASSAIKSGLLTSARVLINNPVSNATFQVMEEITRNPAGTVDMVISGIREAVGLDYRRTITGSNLIAIAQAAREGATKGAREALETRGRL